MAIVHEEGRSAPFKIFEININRLSLLISSPAPTAAEINARMTAATESLKNQPDLEALKTLIEQMGDSITVRFTIMTWAVPMLVTFTETYLEQAFTLLINGAFESSTLPSPIVEEIAQKWVKNTIRGGGPSQWVNQLIKFGVTAYPRDMGTKLQKIWEFRHRVTHNAQLNLTEASNLNLSEDLKTIGLFVRTTDFFLTSKVPTSP